MCGIAGIVSLDGPPVLPGVLQRMNDRQAHRGPDGEGYLLAWFSSTGAPEYRFLRHTAEWQGGEQVRVGLAHRRLAILDLSDRGLQPMCARNAWIVFNGEIYNHRELRDELARDGWTFSTRTDTEVLLKSYLQWGDDCLERSQGMFAFAIWDANRRRLFCARDRLGIKPFYYATPQGHVLFASEIKSLLAYSGLPAQPDDDAVLDFLVQGNCDYGERTLFQNVRALPAAHTLTVDLGSGNVAVRRYWELTPAASRNGVSEGGRLDELHALLLDTTTRHLISDVRAGSCLSGGLDSSAVVSLIGKIRRDQPEAAEALGDNFVTFTSCWDDPALDERRYALAAARAMGATPHLVFPTATDFWDTFEKMAWHQDMPFSCLSFYAQWRVMRAAREAGVKVLLDGQGGDEVFGGYAKFRYAYLMSLLRARRLTGFARETAAMVRQGDLYVLDLRRGYRYLPARLRRVFGVDSLLKTALRADWNRVSSESTPATRWWRYASTTSDTSNGWSMMQRIQVDDLMVDTLPQLLRMEDRSSMAFSLEARVPLLDHRLVEYGVRLPDDLKFRNGWSKYAIRSVMQGMIPEEVRLRTTKLGFAAPDRRWLATDLRPQVDQLLAGDMRAARYVDIAALRDAYARTRHRKASTEAYLGLFRVLALEMWMRAFGIAG